ncbi:MAG TPA: SMP-30/gluconolactonase/LRE family protein [Edaphobacter sp.]|jgi:gluconolactonase|nr:SMP-30/gluconolactonase/LRE family protein [Edaphobacter sp.]
MKTLQCVALAVVLSQSFSMVDADARETGIEGGVSTSIASEAPDMTATALKVDRMDAKLDAIVPADAKLERMATGFTWTEGPIWIPAGYLLFAEITSNSIRKLMPDGTVSIFLQPSGYKGTAPYGGKEPGSNGMTLDRSGRLTVAGHAHRDVWRLESLDPKGQVTVLADSYEGKKLNSPNDLVYKSDGSLYFTDPPYGLPTQGDNDPIKELQLSGVYRIPKAFDQKPGAAPARDQLQLLVKDLPRPNGIAFSPDEKYLYVANSGTQKVWMRYRVKQDGTVTDAKVFYDASSDARPGGPDGIKVDREGNLYGSGPGGVWIFSPEGKPLGVILLSERASNVNWGGADRKTLYITASSSIYRVTLKVPGV